MSIKLTTENFIEKAKQIHGDLYDYLISEYKSGKDKIKIICREHGVFEQVAGDHLQGKGCKECGKSSSINHRKYTTESFIKKAVEVHGDVYDYSLVDYVHNRSKVQIICREHGVFNQSPNAHLTGQGCAECGKISTLKHMSRTQDDFINQSNKIHGGIYDYSQSVYNTSKEKVRIICKEHGAFEQVASSHLKGYGCKICSSKIHGFNRGRFTDLVNVKGKGILYVVRLFDSFEDFIKIGITTRTTNHRVSDFPYQVDILHEEIFTNGGVMFDLENHLHRTFREYNYIPNLEFSGMYECFCNISVGDIILEINRYKESNYETYRS
jgi:hypothetical protein